MGRRRKAELIAELELNINPTQCICCNEEALVFWRCYDQELPLFCELCIDKLEKNQPSLHKQIRHMLDQSIEELDENELH